MREVKIGEETVRVRATPVALLFYKQEFNTSLVGDLTVLSDIKGTDGKLDMTRFNELILLQIVWAMAKADKFGQSFPSFTAWLNSFEHIDITDPEFAQPALEEAAQGFFRSKAKHQSI